MITKTYQLETLTCPSCAIKIEGAIKKLNGINEVQVLFIFSKVKVAFDENLIASSKIVEIIENLGFNVLEEK